MASSTSQKQTYLTTSQTPEEQTDLSSLSKLTESININESTLLCDHNDEGSCFFVRQPDPPETKQSSSVPDSASSTLKCTQRCDPTASCESYASSESDRNDSSTSSEERRRCDSPNSIYFSSVHGGSQDSLDSLDCSTSTYDENSSESESCASDDDYEIIDDLLDDIYRSALTFSIVGFAYKYGRYPRETSEVCLLHLCSVEGWSITHVITMDSKPVPNVVREILQDENICKIGIFPGPLFQSEFPFYVKNTLDIRYAAQICGHPPTDITGLAKSILKYSDDVYRGVKPTDKYLASTNCQKRSFVLESYLSVTIFRILKQNFNAQIENLCDFDKLCVIYKNKLFRCVRI